MKAEEKRQQGKKPDIFLADQSRSGTIAEVGSRQNRGSSLIEVEETERAEAIPHSKFD
jgi:hypothetical protein